MSIYLHQIGFLFPFLIKKAQVLEKLKKNWLISKYSKRSRAKGFPKEIDQYLAAMRHDCLAQPADKQRFVVLDTETSGVSATSDRLISIGAVGVIAGEIVLQDTFEKLLKQGSTGGHQTVEVHGILKKELSGASKEPSALRELLAYTRGDILVMHHANFDIGFINQALQRHFGIKLLNPWIDTLSLAIRLENGHKPLSEIDRDAYSLDALAKRYHLPTGPRHSALGDAYTTALLFLKLMSKAQKRGIGQAKKLVNG